MLRVIVTTTSQQNCMTACALVLNYLKQPCQCFSKQSSPPAAYAPGPREGLTHIAGAHCDNATILIQPLEQP